jgi:hypothetical protein
MMNFFVIDKMVLKPLLSPSWLAFSGLLSKRGNDMIRPYAKCGVSLSYDVDNFNEGSVSLALCFYGRLRHSQPA